MLIDVKEMGREGERGRETLIGCLSHAPQLGLNRNQSISPDIGIQWETFQCPGGDALTNRATLARARDNAFMAGLGEAVLKFV